MDLSGCLKQALLEPALSLHHQFPHTRQRPHQVDRRRSGCLQQSDVFQQRPFSTAPNGIALACRKRYAVCGRYTDGRGPAHDHFADRTGDTFRVSATNVFEAPGEPALVKQMK